MAKKLFIAEKPSVAQEFAKALKYQMSRRDGYLESEEAIVTWCVGHLVTMSYPEVYDIKYKKWSVDTLPNIPETFIYEVISGVNKKKKKKQKQKNTVRYRQLAVEPSGCRYNLRLYRLRERGRVYLPTCGAGSEHSRKKAPQGLD